MLEVTVNPLAIWASVAPVGTLLSQVAALP